MDVARILNQVRELVGERYVFPDVGARVAELVDARAAAGRYAAADDPAALADLVTEDLQAINHDLHLRLIHHDEEIPDEPGEEASRAMLVRDAERSMGGIGRVERLDGNVGLLAIDPALYPAELVGDAYAAAMRLLAPTGALVIDLRRCRGGTPSTVALVCSYLLPPETHLNDICERTPDGENLVQSWTLPYVPGLHYGTQRPVFVLTSRDTFSGAEELAYDLQQTGRATIVGETTHGGAHPRIGVRLHPHLEASIPVARSVHPVTGTNWEGVGVRPDVEVPAGDALAAALTRP